MVGTDALDQQFERLAKRLPRAMGNFGRWVRQPRLIWVRIPAGIVLIAAGFVGFLPILGFWMIPLGVIIIAQDVPFLRRPIARALKWALDKWETRQKSLQRR